MAELLDGTGVGFPEGILDGDGTGEALPEVDPEAVAEDAAYLAAVIATIEPEPVRMGLVEDGHTKHGVRKLRVGPITDRSHSHTWERWYQDGTPGYYCRACQSFMTRAEAGR